MIKNAYLSLKKSYGKTILLFLILFLIANLVIAGLSIKEASSKTTDRVRQSLGNEVTLSIDFRNMMAQRETGQAMEEVSEVLTEELANKLADIEYVESYNYSLNTSVQCDLTPIESSVQQMPEKGNMQPMNQGSSISLSGNLTMAHLSSFENGNYTLLEGELLDEEDAGSGHCLIETNLASENSLELGDTIDITSLKDDSITQTLTITGVFEVVSDEAMPGKGMGQNAVNTIYTDLNTVQVLNNDEAQIQSASYYLDDPEHFTAFEEEAKITDIDFDIYSLRYDNQLFENNQSSLTSLTSFATLFLMIVIVAGSAVLCLILALTLRSRFYEFGIFLSLGQSKLKIIGQQLLEIMMIASLAFVLSLSTGKMTSQMVSGMLESSTQPQMQEDMHRGGFGGMQLEDALKKPENKELDVSMTAQTIGYLALVSTGICVVSTLIPTLYILRLTPREILVRKE